MTKDNSATLGVLYVVATPIGHSDDLTLRAIQVLKSVHTVLAEDTRVTAVLLRAIDARPESLLSSDQYREASRIQTVLDRLSAGLSAAVVSDAGTPGISDPGAPIVSAARAAGFKVIPVPGCSAIAALVSISGLADGRFVFEGFLPASKSGRNKRLEVLSKVQMSVLLYEAPHRIREFAESVVEVFGEQAELIIGRELTKTHEEIWAGQSKDFAVWLEENAFRTKGEFAILITPVAVDDSGAVTNNEAYRWLSHLVPIVGTNSAAKIAMKACGISRTASYELALTISNKLAAT
jgi:16S rRNA (cytidine1402-2'-O)-methyltransferase